jgi:hypothetical protein
MVISDFVSAILILQGNQQGQPEENKVNLEAISLESYCLGKEARKEVRGSSSNENWTKEAGTFENIEITSSQS